MQLIHILKLNHMLVLIQQLHKVKMADELIHQYLIRSAQGTKFAATAAALPPLDPPGTVFKFHGFLVFLNAEYSVEAPIANSSILSFPK